ncbi:hypothetical protein ACIGO6_40440 [Streptomyces sp. NPDC053750]|uniref:hypothetical protein n=1 Tax=Streptomyces sp. NPDC053750 TaxID=3365714 RepID=UPI0037D5EF80
MDTTLVRVTGGRPLSGRIPVQGSKNIALHLYAAALLADVPVVLTGAPDIIDTGVCAQILRYTGAHVTTKDGCFTVPRRTVSARSSTPSSAAASAQPPCWPQRCWPAPGR